MIRKIDNIILLGTSHVAKKSVKDIKDAIKKYEPEVVGIELDINRLKSLLSENRDKERKRKMFDFKLIKEYGITGYLFAMIAGGVQSKIGKSLGIEPGADMKAAYETARENSIATSLIDLNIKVTLRKMSNLSMLRKLKMFSNLFIKSFKKEYRNKINFDLEGVPDEKTILEMMKILEKETPDLYKILIEDRNKHMSDRLLKLAENHEGNILAVVGAGHVSGMEEIIKKKLEENRNNVEMINPEIDNGFNVKYKYDYDFE